MKFLELLMENENIEKFILEFIKEKIKGSKFENNVYIAGGYVRDEIMGKSSKDIDLLVSLPNGGIKLAEFITKKLGIYKKDSNPVIYPKFGTAKFTLNGIKYKGVDLSNFDIECVMSRSEKYDPNSRKPSVKFASLKDDVERRDLTINSLIKNLTTGEIKDLTGMGLKDIQDGVLRTPLDPDITFTDDPLRMLRLVRFAVKYNWKIPMYIIRSLKRNSSKLSKISSERIQSELNKILVSAYPEKGIKLLQITGLLKQISPELDALKGIKQNIHHDFDVFKHTTQVLNKVKPEITNRLAALFHDIGKPIKKEIINNSIHFYQHEEASADLAKEIMKRLKYPNDIIDAVTTAVKNHMRTKSGGDAAEISDKSLRKLQNDLGNHLELTLDLIDADNKSHSKNSNMPNQVKNIKDKIMKLKEKDPVNIKLPINGFDIMNEFGIKEGKNVGEILDFVKDKYFENPNISKTEVIKLIKKEFKL